MPNPSNKITFTQSEKQVIKENFYKISARELANMLGKKIHRVRMEAYAMGLKKMELIRWKKEEVQFLRDNYKEIGDTELSNILNETSPKKGGWHKKHVEKKRNYLNLKRTKAQKKKIHKRNTENGMFAVCVKKRWETTATNPIGTIVSWKDRYYIKTEQGYDQYNRYLWEREKGPIPDDKIVKSTVMHPVLPTIKDLMLITRAENAAINSMGFHTLPEPLKKAIKLNNKLKKAIK